MKTTDDALESHIALRIKQERERDNPTAADVKRKHCDPDQLREIIVSYDTVLYTLRMEFCHIDERALEYIAEEMKKLRPLWMDL